MNGDNPQGEEFGLERLEKTIRQACDCSAEEVIARLRLAVESFVRAQNRKTI
jgi:hypothetical protein